MLIAYVDEDLKSQYSVYGPCHFQGNSYWGYKVKGEMWEKQSDLFMNVRAVKEVKTCLTPKDLEQADQF